MKAITTLCWRLMKHVVAESVSPWQPGQLYTPVLTEQLEMSSSSVLINCYENGGGGGGGQ